VVASAAGNEVAATGAMTCGPGGQNIRAGESERV
jgi:hypothetical protein